jgi:hypothetical protein
VGKISLLEFSAFWVEYFKYKRYPHQRFGQAFYNTHVHDGIPNPDLFYTKDIEKAKTIIFDRYVEIPEVKTHYVPPREYDNVMSILDEKFLDEL